MSPSRILILAFLLAVAVVAPLGAQEFTSCRVAFVVDGDTFNCESGTTVRLRLVDAPDGGRFGELSRRALVRLLPRGSTVRLETETERDSQNRLLAYVYDPDGRMVNRTLVRLGYAFLKPRAGGRHIEMMRAAELEARRRSLGVWAE